MLMRIIFSFFFIYKWQKDNKLDESSKSGEHVSILSILPDKTVVAVLVAVLSVGIVSAFYSPNVFVHVGVGCLLLACFFVAVWKKEKKLFSDIRRMWSGKTQ